MESLPNDSLLKFHPDTLQAIRKIYDLDKPGRMNEAIDILDSWVKKQDHFLKKDFDRDYLERTIISTKGSIERAKKQLDKRCTKKTLCPNFFKIHNPKEDFKDLFQKVNQFVLPKLTKDHYRVFFNQSTIKGVTLETMLQYYKYCIMMAEYSKSHDYCNGVIFIIDHREVNVLDLVSCINVSELRQVMSIHIEGYGYRIKGIHILSTSKMIDTFLAILKQAMSQKLAKRIRVHTTLESLYEYVPKNLLPAEYGGEEKSMEALQNDWKDTISSDEYMNYLKIMFKAGTDESLRSTDVFNDKYLGMPGTFRTLNVD